jgi:arylsulfatase A-like enzyme
VDIIAASEGYRTKKWKYFRYREDMAHEELYDLSKDPLEKHNLAGNATYASVLTDMRGKMERKIQDLETKRAK